MNLTEAWKAAKPGQSIRRPGYISIVKYSESDYASLKDYFSFYPRTLIEHILADDWMVETLKRKEEFLSVTIYQGINGVTAPCFTTSHEIARFAALAGKANIKMTLEWEE